MLELMTDSSEKDAPTDFFGWLKVWGAPAGVDSSSDNTLSSLDSNCENWELETDWELRFLQDSEG